MPFWSTMDCMGKLVSMLENYIKWKISCHGTFNGWAGGVWQATSCRAFVALRPPTCTSVLDPTQQTVISSLPRQAALCRCEPGVLSQGRLRPPSLRVFSWFQEVIDTRLLATLYFLCMQKCFSSLLLVIGIFFTPYNLGHTSSLSLIRRHSWALLIFLMASRLKSFACGLLSIIIIESFLPTFWLHFSVASFARTQTAVSWL